MNKRLSYLTQLIESGKADAFAHYALALEYKKEGQLSEAAATFDQLCATFPDYLPQYLIAGQMHLDGDNPELARTWLEKGLILAKKTGDSKAAGEIEAALSLC
jgi:tetratricopeptide (TPR) repeat protein